MTTKRCSICKQEKSSEEFNKNSWKKDGLQPACKPCNKERSAAYYKRKTEHHKQITRKQKIILRARNAQFIWDYFLLHPCVDCGDTNPIVLEFDHVRGEKMAAVSDIVRNSGSLDKIKLEIEKCEVRCVKCHRIKTANQLGWYKNINTGL